MKKILLPGMLATLAFAACTNEEIISQQTEAPEVDLSNRPVVGMVDLSFGPQTRLALEDDHFNKVVWENEDEIGARIIDAPNNSNYEDHSLNYTANDDYASSNYLYKKDGSMWNSQALMVEGHYMFYAPYNAEQGRDPLTFNFPYNQQIDKLVKGSDDANTDAVANFIANTAEREKDNNEHQTVLVGHSFVSANGETRVSPVMEHLYAYPQITLENAKKFYALNGTDTIAKELKIKYILISDGEGQIKDSYKASHSGLIKMLRDKVEADWDNRDEYDNTWGMDAGSWRSSLSLLRDGKSSDIWNDAKGAQNTDIRISMEEVYAMTDGEAVQFHAVLPALEYHKVQTDDAGEITQDGLTLNVVFEGNDGNLWKFVNGVTFSVDNNVHETMTLAPGKRYPREEYNFSDSYDNGYQTKETAGQLATFKLVSGKAVKYVADQRTPDIRNYTEFGQMLDKLVDNTKTITEGEDFRLEKRESDPYKGLPMMTFDENLVKVVKQYLDEGKVVFKSQMVVIGDFSGNNAPSIDDYQFEGGVILEDGSKLALSGENIIGSNSTFNGEVTLTGVEAADKEMTFNGKATVDGGEYGTLNFEGEATLKNGVKATTVNLKNGATNIGSLEATTLNINGGKVSIPADFAGSLNNINVKNATLETSKAIASNIKLGEYREVNNKWYCRDAATLDVKAADFDLKNVTLEAGSVDLNADAKMDGDFADNWKSGKVTNNAGKKLTVDNVTIPAVAKNESNATLTFVNKGTVSGSLSVAANAKVENNYELQVNQNEGTITTGTDSRTYVSDTQKAGVIDNSSLSFVQAGDNQTVYAKFADNYSDLTVDVLENKGPGLRYINKLILGKGMTIDKPFSSDLLDNVKVIDVEGGDIVVKTFASTSVEEMNIMGNVIIRGTLDRENTGFGFKNGAAINVAEGKTLTVAYTTVATLSSTAGLMVDGNVLVKDAYLYLGLGSAPEWKTELNGHIENAYFDVASMKEETQHSDALKAAVNRKDAVIDLHNNVVMGTAELKINYNLELNLNGNSLTSSNTTATIQLTAGNSLTINGENGSVINNAAGAEVILNLGGNLTINGGTYHAQGSGNSAAVACSRSNGSGTWNLTIEDGTFISQEFTAVSLQNNRGSEGSAATDGLATIKKGTFTGGGNYYDLYLAYVNANISTVVNAITYTNNKIYMYVDAENNSKVNGNLITLDSNNVNSPNFVIPAEK